MKNKPWSKVIEEAGQRVRIYEKRAGGPFWISVTTGSTVSANGKRRPVEDRKSLGHTNRAQAEAEAKALARELAEMRLTGRALDVLTLGQLFAQYRLHAFPSLTPQRRKEANARMAMFVECWGRDLDVFDLTQSRIGAYVRKRRTLEIIAPGLREREDGTRPIGWRTPKSPRDGALHGELSGLSTICNWAVGHRVNGKRFLAENPLRGLDWPKRRTRAVQSQAKNGISQRKSIPTRSTP